MNFLMKKAKIVPVIIRVAIQKNRVAADCRFAFLNTNPKIVAGMAEKIAVMRKYFLKFIAVKPAA